MKDKTLDWLNFEQEVVDEEYFVESCDSVVGAAVTWYHYFAGPDVGSRLRLAQEEQSLSNELRL